MLHFLQPPENLALRCHLTGLVPDRLCGWLIFVMQKRKVAPWQNP